MPVTLESLGIDRLTVEERLALAHEIWESVEAEEPQPLTEAQMREVDRRWIAHRADPNAAVPWEQVEAEALARLEQ